MAQKEAYLEQGYPNWSRRDFQQFVKGLEAYGWYVVFQFFLGLCSLVGRDQRPEVYAADIQEKTAEEVEKYYKTFKRKWKTLSGELNTLGTNIYSQWFQNTLVSKLESPKDSRNETNGPTWNSF